MIKHRANRQPARNSRPREKRARRPRQVWSWDITYLPTSTRGRFWYLYLIMDVFSRKIVGWAVHEREDSELSAALIDRACQREGIRRDQLTLHSDNGGPMKGSTMLAKLQDLGVMPSFSRPSVSNDNPYSESLFGTLKTRPSYPGHFESLETACAWMKRFVQWHNDEHLHSSIGYVTPNQRHNGTDVRVLQKRRRVYEQARQRHPERFRNGTRSWARPETILLNPDTKVVEPAPVDRRRSQAKASGDDGERQVTLLQSGGRATDAARAA